MASLKPVLIVKLTFDTAVNNVYSYVVKVLSLYIHNTCHHLMPIVATSCALIQFNFNQLNFNWLNLNNFNLILAPTQNHLLYAIVHILLYKYLSFFLLFRLRCTSWTLKLLCYMYALLMADISITSTPGKSAATQWCK